MDSCFNRTLRFFHSGVARGGVGLGGGNGIMDGLVRGSPILEMDGGGGRTATVKDGGPAA